ncbi:hypothetical protein TYRP_010274 [Tyrophagus putrescentiae]|nr:hypothetical protein TYRP_010274 [Tyrophagus putrescentiae]
MLRRRRLVVADASVPTLFELIEKVNVEAAEDAHAETPDALHPEEVLPEGHLEGEDGAEKGPDDEGGGKDRHRISVLLHPKLGPKLLLRLCLLPRLLVGGIGVRVDIAEGQPDNADKMERRMTHLMVL